MQQSHEELEREVLAEYRAMMRGFKAVSGSVWMDTELTVPQLRTLLILAEEGPLVIGQVAQRLGIGLSTGGHLVERLVQAGLAERAEDADDRRRVLARLTPQGEELHARLLSGIQQMQIWLREVDEDDLAAFLRGIRAINRLVDQKRSLTCCQVVTAERTGKTITLKTLK